MGKVGKGVVGMQHWKSIWSDWKEPTVHNFVVLIQFTYNYDGR